MNSPPPAFASKIVALAGAKDTAADDTFLFEARRLFDNLHHHYSRDAYHD